MNACSIEQELASFREQFLCCSWQKPIKNYAFVENLSLDVNVTLKFQFHYHSRLKNFIIFSAIIFYQEKSI